MHPMRWTPERYRLLLLVITVAAPESTAEALVAWTLVDGAIGADDIAASKVEAISVRFFVLKSIGELGVLTLQTTVSTDSVFLCSLVT